MSEFRKSSMMIPTARACFKAAIGTIGMKGTATRMGGTITPDWSDDSI